MVVMNFLSEACRPELFEILIVLHFTCFDFGIRLGEMKFLFDPLSTRIFESLPKMLSIT